MRIRLLAILMGGLVCSVGRGEYKELETLKQASREALKLYADRLAAVDPKFEGVVKFGQALKAIEDLATVDVAKLTYQSKHYWRAQMEMVPKDPAIVLAHAYLHAARGEVSYAQVYFLLAGLTLEKSRRGELQAYERLADRLDKRIAREIDKGIKFHDRGKYAEALAAYDKVLSEHPNCAWAYYEKGFAYMMMGRDDLNLTARRVDMFAQCRRCDPFYLQAYQGSDGKVLDQLMVLGTKVLPFSSGKQRTKEGLAAFAEGCEAMELYPLAAHARWLLTGVDSDHFREHIKSFLDLIEKCGCEDAAFFRSQFKLDGESGNAAM